MMQGFQQSWHIGENSCKLHWLDTHREKLYATRSASVVYDFRKEVSIIDAIRIVGGCVQDKGQLSYYYSDKSKQCKLTSALPFQ